MYGDDERFYRSSGAAPLGGIVLMLGLGIVSAAILSVVYAFVDYYNPFIYVTFLATIVFGVGVGMAVTIGATLGKIRSRLCTRVVGIAAGLLAAYLSWVWFIWIVSDYALTTFNPERLWLIMTFIGNKGLWELKGGLRPTGWGLYSFWIVEAVIIVGAACLMSSGNDSPFCETCNAWTDDLDNVALLEMADFDELRRQLENERYEPLETLCTGNHSPDSFLKVKLHTCPECEESNYLSIKHVKVTVDKSGDPQTSETDVIQNLRIPADLVTRLKTASVPEASERPVDGETDDAHGDDDGEEFGENREDSTE